MLDRTARRTAFDRIAQEYDAMRPGYSREAINFALPPAPAGGGSLLEVGCGSGQATRSLVGRGYRITAIDISPNLLEIARRRFRNRPEISFGQVSFEDFIPEKGETFDVILAPTSWHWIDPDIGLRKAAELLLPGGRLSIMAHIAASPRRGFDLRVQEVYNRVVPEWRITPGTRTTADVIRALSGEMQESHLFRDIISIEFPQIQSMKRIEYIQLLGTYSDHRNLPPEQFHRLCEEIGNLIDREYNGRIDRRYSTFLCHGTRYISG